MAALLCAAAVFGLLFGGCRKKPAEDDTAPLEGGNTTYVDGNAPKEIESKDLVEFSAAVYLATRFRGDEERDFEFEIAPDGEGGAVAAERITGIRCPADKELTGALADVIAKNGLAAQNGVYDVTAGLSSEYRERTFRAVYASGEVLTFTLNNDPYAEWAEEVYDVFAAWFSAHGVDTLYPEEETSLITSFSLEFTDGRHSYWYTEVNVGEDRAIDGETYLLSRYVDGLIFDSDKVRLFPDDYYERLTEIVGATDLLRRFQFSWYDRAAGNLGNHDEGYYGWGDKTTADGEEDSEKMELILSIEYESGNWVDIETRKASEIKAMRPLIDALMKYLDSLF